MTTIETTATVTSDRMLLIPLPPSIPTGKHRVVVVIDEQPITQKKRLPLRFSKYPAGLRDDNFTFRREDLYGDE
jgi:hypothetical protein